MSWRTARRRHQTQGQKDGLGYDDRCAGSPVAVACRQALIGRHRQQHGGGKPAGFANGSEGQFAVAGIKIDAVRAEADIGESAVGRTYSAATAGLIPSAKAGRWAKERNTSANAASSRTAIPHFRSRPVIVTSRRFS